MRPSTSRRISLALVLVTLSTRTSAVPVPLDDLAGLTATLNSLTGAGSEPGGESNVGLSSLYPFLSYTDLHHRIAARRQR